MAAVRFTNTSAQQRDVAGRRRDGARKPLPLQDDQAVGCRLERPRVGAVLRDQLLDQTLRERDVGLRVTDLAGLHQEPEVVHEAPHRVRRRRPAGSHRAAFAAARRGTGATAAAGFRAASGGRPGSRHTAATAVRRWAARDPRPMCGGDAAPVRAPWRGTASPCSTRCSRSSTEPGSACASRFVRCNAAFERATRTHRVGQFGDHAIVDDRAVRGRRDADGAQVRAGGRVVVVNRADQRLRGAAQQVDLQVARDRQAACSRQHGAHPDLRAQRVGIARGVDVAHQRRRVGAQLTQRLFELGVAALDDARDFDVGGDLVVVHQRQLELAALARRARAARSALPSVCSCSDDTARRTKSSRWACNTRRASTALAERIGARPRHCFNTASTIAAKADSDSRSSWSTNSASVGR